MKKYIIILSCFFVLSSHGCAQFVASDLKDAMSIRQSTSISTKNVFDESKIVYVKDLRCYTYRAESDKKELESCLFDQAGRKIAAKDEAVERVRSAYDDKVFSKTEKVLGIATLVWAVPVGLAIDIVGNVAQLPAYPYVEYLLYKFPKEAYEYYSEGNKLLDQMKYREARQKLYLALNSWPSLRESSDIFFKIAQTYDKENMNTLSERYYKNFLECSMSLYPDYFKEYDSTLINDRNKLDIEFTEAEKKLGMLQASATSAVAANPN